VLLSTPGLGHHPTAGGSPLCKPIHPPLLQTNRDAQLYHYLFLNNNAFWTEIPGYMLEAIAVPGENFIHACWSELCTLSARCFDPAVFTERSIKQTPWPALASPHPTTQPTTQPTHPADRNPCRCEAYIDLSNNTRFCPTRASLDFLVPGVLKALVIDSNIEISCLRSDFTVTGLREYLQDPSSYTAVIPPAPPISKKARSASASPKTIPGSKLTPGGAAGVVIGVLAAVGGLGALVWFVVRPKWQERRATGFFKTKELDAAPIVPPAAVPSATLQHSPSDAAMAAFEAGWGRYAQNGAGGSGGVARFDGRGGSAV